MTLRLHVVYEHSGDLAPHGCAHIRLLRPLSHPSIAGRFDLSFGTDFHSEPVDAVVIDRLWKTGVTVKQAAALVDRIRRSAARLIYAIDDNLLQLPTAPRRWPFGRNHVANEMQQVAEYFLRNADGVLTSTTPLAQRLAPYNPRIAVIPNALDERLLIGQSVSPTAGPFESDRLVVGYMGTATHDDDLLMILPALARVARRHAGRFELQILGAVNRLRTRRALAQLPLRFIRLPAQQVAYPEFMLWFTSQPRWHVALAPLVDSPFTRCKSDIKHLDYSALGTAGIYSHVEPYAASVKHLQTGWLAENRAEAWEDAIETLWADKSCRDGIACRAAESLYAKRTLQSRAVDWANAIETWVAPSADRDDYRVLHWTMPAHSQPQSATTGRLPHTVRPQ